MRGRPVLGEVVALEPAPAAGAGWNERDAEREVLRWAASAETGSKHPLAKPILAAAGALGAQRLGANVVGDAAEVV